MCVPIVARQNKPLFKLKSDLPVHSVIIIAGGDILLELEENLEANSATDSVRCRGRPFTLLPICSHDTKYITVDRQVLKGLLRRVGGVGGNDPDFCKGQNSVRSWDMYFFVKIMTVTLRNLRIFL